MLAGDSGDCRVEEQAKGQAPLACPPAIGPAPPSSGLPLGAYEGGQANIGGGQLVCAVLCRGQYIVMLGHREDGLPGEPIDIKRWLLRHERALD